LHDVILVQREEGSFNQVNQPVSVPSENFHPHLGPCTEKSPHQAVTQQRRLLEPSMPRLGSVQESIAATFLRVVCNVREMDVEA
jgi:hypothetical protein